MGRVLALVALLAVACGDAPTTLLLTLDGPAALTSLEVTVTVDGVGTTARTIPLGAGNMKLPGTLLVELPDRAVSVTIDLAATGPGLALTAHTVVTAEPHQQLQLTLTLGPPSADLGVDSAPLVADLGAPGDLSMPDLSLPDLSRPAPLPRFISSSYYSGGAAFPTGMTASGFAITTTGVVDGDLLLIIANVDNGGTTVWPIPIAPGFNQLAQDYFGSDGQTYVASWKIASGEPAIYTGNYGPGAGSSAAVITLIAVSGVSAAQPINAFVANHGSGAGTSPTVATSPGVTTTVPNCALVYAAGADWLSSPGTNTFTVPSGYHSLAQLGDHGDNGWDWSSQMVAWGTQAAAGATGSISGTLGSTQTGIPWAVVFAIAP